MIKTNLDGILQWAKTYGGTNEDEPFQVQQTSDTGFVLAGYTQSFGAGFLDFMVVKTDTGGNVLTEILQYMMVSAISPIITSLSLGSNVSPGIINPTIITGGCPRTYISEGCYITVTQPGE
jgi:hypothetical protein